MIELCEEIKCTGCGACVNICPENCIKMVKSEEGFDHPLIDHELCTSCGLCQKSCPVLSPLNLDNDKNPNVYAAWNLDDKIRMKSSSGGIFSTIANYTLKNKGVVYGATFDSDWNVKHIGITTEDELPVLRGSKYVQSEIGLIFREVKKNLRNGQLVLFVGTPCQIAGLYKFLNNKFNNLLITIDLVCHGVPSPTFFKDYLNKIPIDINKLDAFAFRDTKGWAPRQLIKYKGKWRYITSNKNIYFRLFWSSYTQRECCYQCPYTRLPRVGDLTIGDFWGLGTKIPFNHDTSKGVSLLLINSAKGLRVFNKIKHKCFIEKRSFEEASKHHNHQLKTPPKRPSLRDTVFEDFKKLSIMEIEEIYIYPTYSPSLKKFKKIKYIALRILKTFGYKLTIF